MTATPLHTQPDHLVITAASLQAGMAWVEERLGVSMAPRIGGEHVRLGTHNALLQLGDGFYLEVIAIDPAAPTPARARWFGLDALPKDAAPRLAHWVARTNDIHAAVAASPISPGPVQAMSRGALNWLITIADDGQLAADGVMPSLIQWQADPHPATALPDLGCRLVQLELAHPQAAAIGETLHAIGLQDARVSLSADVAGRKSLLAAQIMTPHGLRVLA